jgi:hypothetical protein
MRYIDDGLDIFAAVIGSRCMAIRRSAMPRLRARTFTISAALDPVTIPTGQRGIPDLHIALAFFQGFEASIDGRDLQ